MLVSGYTVLAHLPPDLLQQAFGAGEADIATGTCCTDVKERGTGLTEGYHHVCWGLCSAAGGNFPLPCFCRFVPASSPNSAVDKASAR